MRLAARPAVSTSSAWLLAAALAVFGLSSLVGATPPHLGASERAVGGAPPDGTANCHDPLPAGADPSHTHPALPDCCAVAQCLCGAAFGPTTAVAAPLAVGRAPRAAPATPAPAAALRAYRLLRPPIVARG